MQSIIPLSDIATRAAQLEIRCVRFPRAGRVSTGRLLAKYGPGGSTWLQDLAKDCPRYQSRSVYEACSLYAPELVEWFRESK